MMRREEARKGRRRQDLYGEALSGFLSIIFASGQGRCGAIPLDRKMRERKIKQSFAYSIFLSHIFLSERERRIIASRSGKPRLILLAAA
jgi:hypothetical protein